MYSMSLFRSSQIISVIKFFIIHYSGGDQDADVYVDMSVGNPDSHDPIPLQSLKEFSMAMLDANLGEKDNIENPIYATKFAGQEKLIENPMYDSVNPEEKSITSHENQSEGPNENIYETIPGQNYPL